MVWSVSLLDGIGVCENTIAENGVAANQGNAF